MTPADVQAFRRQHGLTQPTLAARLGVHWVTVARWETGKNPVPAFLNLALAELARQIDAPKEQTMFRERGIYTLDGTRYEMESGPARGGAYLMDRAADTMLTIHGSGTIAMPDGTTRTTADLIDTGETVELSGPRAVLKRSRPTTFTLNPDLAATMDRVERERAQEQQVHPRHWPAAYGVPADESDYFESEQ